jgi:hypothetical protein
VHDVTIDGDGDVVVAGTLSAALDQTGSQSCGVALDLVVDGNAAVVDPFVLRLGGGDGCYTGDGRMLPNVDAEPAERDARLTVAAGADGTVVVGGRVSGTTDLGAGPVGENDVEQLFVAHYDALSAAPRAAVAHAVEDAPSVALDAVGSSAYLAGAFSGDLAVAAESTLTAAGVLDSYVVKYGL